MFETFGSAAGEVGEFVGDHRLVGGEPIEVRGNVFVDVLGALQQPPGFGVGPAEGGLAGREQIGGGDRDLRRGGVEGQVHGAGHVFTAGEQLQAVDGGDGAGFPVRAVTQLLEGSPAGARERQGGVFTLGEVLVADCHSQGAGGACGDLFDHGCQLVDIGLPPGDLAGGVFDEALAAGDRVEVGTLQGVEAGDFVGEFHLLDVAGVPGGSGFGFGGTGSELPPNVVDFGGVDLVAFDLFDEHGFGFDFLPHERVEAALGHIVEDFHGGVLVALADHPPFALLEIGGPPRDIDMVQRHGAGLHVGAGSHFLCRADQYRHCAAVAFIEQPQSVLGGAGIVDEPDRGGVHALLDQLVADRGIHRKGLALLGSSPVAEHDLQPAGAFHGGFGVRGYIDVVGGLVVDPHDFVGHRFRAGGFGFGQVRQPRVQRHVAAVVADFEDVVEVHAAGVDVLGAVGQVGDEVLDLLAGGDRDDLAAPADQPRQRESCSAAGDLGAGDDIGERRGQREKLLKVGELAHPGHRVQSGPGGVGFHGVDRGGEGVAPVVDVGGAAVGEQVRPQVGLHDIQLAETVGDGGSGGERGHPLDHLCRGCAGGDGFIAAAPAQHHQFEVEVGGLGRP